MPASSLKLLTRREQAVADFFRRVRVAHVWMVAAAAILGLLACGLGQAYCYPPTDPVSGSAALSYCAKMAHGYSWIAYVAAAAALAVAVRWIWRGRYARRIALLIVSVAVISSTVWVYSLPTGFG